MYDIIDKLEKRATDISNQITELQNQLRKYYIDAYLDVQQRETEDEMDEFGEYGVGRLDKKPVNVKQLEQKDDEDGIVITSPEDLRSQLDAKRIEAAKKKLAENIKEIEVEEI